jgi:hypothetical protein
MDTPVQQQVCMANNVIGKKWLIPARTGVVCITAAVTK